MRDRPLGRSGVSISELGVSLLPEGMGPSASPLRDEGLVRYAERCGVRLFDLTASRSPVLTTERLFAGSKRGPRRAVIVPWDRAGVPAGPSGPTRRSGDVAPRSGGEPAGVLPPDTTFLAELEAGSPDDLDRSVRAVRDAAQDGRVAAWGVRPGPKVASLEALRPALEAGASWLRVPYNLLTREPFAEARRVAGDLGVSLLAVDPFAGGRLNGRFLYGHLLEGGPPRPPPELATLRRDLDPVLKLGFLARARERTLLEAALLYARHPPEVASVLVEAPTIAELDAIGRLDGVPALTGEELARIEGLAASGVPAGPGSPAAREPGGR